MKIANANDIFHRISEEKQNTILQAALNEFAQYGYSEANINKIAEHAHISVGSLYKYFNDKQSLYLAIVSYSADTLREVLNQIMEESSDFFTIVERIIREIQHHARINGNLFRLYNEMTAENNFELTWKTSGSVESVTADLYTSLIEKAQAEGSIRKEINARYSAFFLDNLFILLQFSYSCDYYRERLKLFAGEAALHDDEVMCEEMIRFIKAALLK